jgi:spore coat protein U-like protein
VSYRIGINAGLHDSTVWANNRHLHSAVSGDIAYMLYAGGVAVGDKGLTALDASYTETTAAWTSGSGDALPAATGSGAAQSTALTYNVYPLTGATTNPAPAGTYSDTIVVTVAW